MRKLFTQRLQLFVIVFFAVALNAKAQAPEGYTTILSDDFDGTELNADYWTKGLWGGGELLPDGDVAHLFPRPGNARQKLNEYYAGYILDRNTVVNNGILELHNKKEDYYGTSPAAPGGKPWNFTNGWINGLGKVKFNGCKKGILMKMRMKLPPHTQDVWPAVWLVAQEAWPPEIDIFEYFGSNYNNTGTETWRDFMALRYIWGGTASARKKDEAIHFNRDYNSAEFQEYEFEWTDYKMVTRVNGKEIGRLVRGGAIPYDRWPGKDVEWSLVINNGRMQTVVDAFGLDYCSSNVFEMDYIHVYEKETEETASVTEIIDPLEDYSKVYYRASDYANTQLWLDENGYFAGDKFMLCRAKDKTASIMYNLKDFADFEIDYWEASGSGTIKAYGSHDGVNFTDEIAISVASTATTEFAWDKNTYKPTVDLTALGYDFLKIELSGPGFWQGQIGEVRVYTTPQNNNPCDIPVTGVSVQPTLTMTVGQTHQLSASVLPTDACNTDVTWESTNNTKATVDQNGLVTAHEAGTVEITVETEEGGFVGTCQLTIEAADEPVTGVTLSVTELSLDEGQTVQLTATVLPTNATNQNVSWESDDASVSVNENGLATAKAEGSATITVETEDGAFTASCTITVNAEEAPTSKPKRPTGVQVEPASTSLKFSWDVMPNASYYRIGYRDSNSAWAYVDVQGKYTQEHTVEGLLPSTQYSYKVRAGNVLGFSPWSAESQISTLSAATQKSALVGLSSDEFKLRIYPSVSSQGYFSMDFNTVVDKASVRIYNAAGQLQKSLDFSNEMKVQIETSQLNKGLHIVKVHCGQEVAVQKIIIK